MKPEKTKAELRIEIAKDVLKHIDAERITTQRMVYFDACTDSDSDHFGEQLKGVIPKFKICRVCALGGMFYAHINRHNKFTINLHHSLNSVRVCSYDIKSELSMFSDDQISKIESSFECCDNYRVDHNLIDDEKALIHIMNNIIKNKGTFNPESK